MRVLVLSPYPHHLLPVLYASGDMPIEWDGAPETWPDADFIVSYGYRHIIREPHLSQYRGRMINLHIGFLPWNRGADPNFWSWFENTPKGVSLHAIEAGIDTGPLLGQYFVEFGRGETLRTSYNMLRKAVEALFGSLWSLVRLDRVMYEPQEGTGTSHKKSDAEPWMRFLPQGHDTPVADVEQLGWRAPLVS